MQEKTLEEEIFDLFNYMGYKPDPMMTKEIKQQMKENLTLLISSREQKAREEGRKEERQFILNVLDGIDIADKEMGIVGGTQAIRQALQSRIFN